MYPMEITSRNSIQRISKPHYIYMPLHIGTGSYIGTNLYIYKAYLLITHIYTFMSVFMHTVYIYKYVHI